MNRILAAFCCARATSSPASSIVSDRVPAAPCVHQQARRCIRRAGAAEASKNVRVSGDDQLLDLPRRERVERRVRTSDGEPVGRDASIIACTRARRPSSRRAARSASSVSASTSCSGVDTARCSTSNHFFGQMLRKLIHQDRARRLVSRDDDVVDRFGADDAVESGDDLFHVMQVRSSRSGAGIAPATIRLTRSAVS